MNYLSFSQKLVYPKNPIYKAKEDLKNLFIKYAMKIDSKIKMIHFKEFFLCYIITQQIEKSKNKIISFLRQKNELFELKKRIMILKIIKTRNESAKKIQDNYRKHILYLSIHKKAHHVNGCYTISPSINNVTRMDIKIFQNSQNINDYKISSLKFCPIRKKFVIDIKKNKFISNSKKLYFVFIYKGQNYYDKNYNIIDFQGEKVHVIDFEDVDKNIIELEKNIYSPASLKSCQKFFWDIRPKSLAEEEKCFKKESKPRTPLKPRTLLPQNKSQFSDKLCNEIRKFSLKEGSNTKKERMETLSNFLKKNIMEEYDKIEDEKNSDVNELFFKGESRIFRNNHHKKKINSILKNKINKSGKIISVSKNQKRRKLSCNDALKAFVSFGEINYCN